MLVRDDAENSLNVLRVAALEFGSLGVFLGAVHLAVLLHAAICRQALGSSFGGMASRSGTALLDLGREGQHTTCGRRFGGRRVYLVARAIEATEATKGTEGLVERSIGVPGRQTEVWIDHVLVVDCEAVVLIDGEAAVLVGGEAALLIDGKAVRAGSSGRGHTET